MVNCYITKVNLLHSDEIYARYVATIHFEKASPSFELILLKEHGEWLLVRMVFNRNKVFYKNMVDAIGITNALSEELHKMRP